MSRLKYSAVQYNEMSAVTELNKYISNLDNLVSIFLVVALEAALQLKANFE